MTSSEPDPDQHGAVWFLKHYRSHPPSPDGKTIVLLFQLVVLFLHDDEHDLPDALPPTQPANSVPTLTDGSLCSSSFAPDPTLFSPTTLESDVCLCGRGIIGVEANCWISCSDAKMVSAVVKLGDAAAIKL